MVENGRKRLNRTFGYDVAGRMSNSGSSDAAKEAPVPQYLSGTLLKKIQDIVLKLDGERHPELMAKFKGYEVEVSAMLDDYQKAKK